MSSPRARAAFMESKRTVTAFSALRSETPCSRMSIWTRPRLPFSGFELVTRKKVLKTCNTLY